MKSTIKINQDINVCPECGNMDDAAYCECTNCGYNYYGK